MNFLRWWPLVAALVATAQPAAARPITYVGGWMSMTEWDGDGAITSVEHTFHRHWAVGAYALTEGGDDRLSAGVVVNRLLLRENAPGAQANAYLLAGVGPSFVRREGGGRETVGSGWVGLEADWETRRWFVGGSTRVSLVDGEAEAGWRGRLGVAPYVAPTGALHTWLFVQAGRAAEPGRRTEVGPVVRLFRGPVLAEAGVTHRGSGFATLWFYF